MSCYSFVPCPQTKIMPFSFLCFCVSHSVNITLLLLICVLIKYVFYKHSNVSYFTSESNNTQNSIILVDDGDGVFHLVAVSVSPKYNWLNFPFLSRCFAYTYIYLTQQILRIKTSADPA